MKRNPLNLLFATMVGLTLSSNGATLFTEDFSGNTAGPNLTLGSAYGSPTTSFASSDFTITSGEGSRIYLGTNDADYNTIDFVFTATVTLPNNTSPWSLPFFGMGTPTARGDAYGEPTLNQYLLMGYRADDKQFQERNNAGTNGPISSAFAVEPLAGFTHKIRMEWNATTKTAIFTFDAFNDGILNGPSDFTFSRDATANGFTSTASQLFVGGGNGLTFDNVTVAPVVPEPGSVVLLGLGLTAIGWRRRR